MYKIWIRFEGTGFNKMSKFEIIYYKNNFIKKIRFEGTWFDKI